MIQIEGRSIHTAGIVYPHSREAEEIVIGHLLAAGEMGEGTTLFRLTSTYLRPTDFFFIDLSVIYESCLRLYEQGAGIDIQTVSADLRQRIGNQTALDFIGGNKRLYTLANVVPRHTATHARSVLSLSLRRCAILICRDEIARTLDSNQDILAIQVASAALRRDLHARLALLARDSSVTTIEVWQDYQEALASAIDDPQHQSAIPIWLDGLQDRLSGWQPRRLYTLAAGTNMGKSTFLCNAALQAASNHRVIFLSLETPLPQLIERLTAIHARIDGRHLQTRTLSPAERQRLAQTRHTLAELVARGHLRLQTLQRPTIRDIQASLDQLRYQRDADIAFIDYLGVETTRYDGDERFATSKKHADQIWTQIGDFRRLFNIPLVVATQINRNYMERPDKRPLRTDVADSSLCEKTSDVLMILHRVSVVDELGLPNLADITIEKNRSGPAGTSQRFDIGFDEATGQIANLARQH